ncbi:MAG TPA: DUF1566 domain-containing protein [Myxococcaceae bacterium]|nr:DUF1566 domain-containing protein [Myxococcaceae bacterium]
MRSRLVLNLSCAVVLTLSAAPARAADQVSANVRFDFLKYDQQEFVWDSPELLPFPLEAYGVMTKEGPFSDFLLPVPFNMVMWAFANETGRVRAAANTLGIGLGRVKPPPPGDKENMFRTRLHWEKRFTKNSPTDTATFTVNRSELTVFDQTIPTVGRRAALFPYASIFIEVDLVRPRLALKDHRRVTPQIFAAVELERFPTGGGCGDGFAVQPFVLWLCQYGEDRNGPFSGNDSPLKAFLAVEKKAEIGIDTQVYRGTIDLSAVGVGEPYTVTYLLEAEAFATGEENHTDALIGDPLDTASGLSLDVTSPPAPASERAGQLCDTVPDTLRYVDYRDGTVTDVLTGLMWQRCAVGSHLDDSGTPDDPSDDRCAEDSGGKTSWEAALQAAAANGAGGHLDWRLPNVKELDSIVEPGCFAPAIESQPFPDTPPALFWSSTPGPGSGTSMGVDFLSGEVTPTGRASLGRARLVRDAGASLLLPPKLSVAQPTPVLEGNSGTVEMVFPVLLDRPASSDVTFHYATADDTARAGEDYDAVSGTGTIPAGALEVDIHVPIRGDVVGEPSETLFLVVDQVSASARLAGAWNRGTILDDEPVLKVRPTDVYEGNSGNSSLVFTVSLSSALSTDVTFAFATADGTAKAGTDYVPTSGTATIPAGQRTVSIPVTVTGDTVPEQDETLFLTISSPSANTRIAVDSAAGLIVDDERPAFTGLDDTGFHNCANATQSFLACPQPGFPGQDAEQGRDASFPSDVDGPSGFVFTKLDASGVPLPDQSLPFGIAFWSCIRDEVTGLWWEVKTNDGGLHDRDWTYTWFDSSGLGTGGDPGTPNGGTCVDVTSCDTEKFAAAVNAAGLCGHSDWRLPGRDELVSILDGTHGTDALSADWFPSNSTTNSTYWTSTARGLQREQTAGTGLSAWSFSTAGQGLALSRSRGQPGAVRLVRGPN